MQPALSMPPTPTYSSQAMAMAMANAQYQQHPQHPQVHQGFSGAPLHPRVASLGTPSGTSAQPPTMPTFIGGNNNASGGGTNGPSGANGGLPPSSAAAAGAGGKGLNTPREEWGSSQTPRSQMIMTAATPVDATRARQTGHDSILGSFARSSSAYKRAGGEQRASSSPSDHAEGMEKRRGIDGLFQQRQRTNRASAWSVPSVLV